MVHYKSGSIFGAEISAPFPGGTGFNGKCSVSTSSSQPWSCIENQFRKKRGKAWRGTPDEVSQKSGIITFPPDDKTVPHVS